jgi:hypothetical protein
MLVRRDHTEQSDSRGRGPVRGRGGARVEGHSERQSSRAQSTPAAAPAAAAPAKQEVDSVGDVPATPRAGSKKAPRQSKPSA